MTKHNMNPLQTPPLKEALFVLDIFNDVIDLDFSVIEIIYRLFGIPHLN